MFVSSVSSMQFLGIQFDSAQTQFDVEMLEDDPLAPVPLGQLSEPSFNLFHQPNVEILVGSFQYGPPFLRILNLPAQTSGVVDEVDQPPEPGGFHVVHFNFLQSLETIGLSMDGVSYFNLIQHVCRNRK